MWDLSERRKVAGGVRWWNLERCCLPAALLAFGLLFGTAHAASRKQRTVVVISLDGFPAYALADPRLPIPTLRKLAREGAAATAMQPINPTVTWPNHTTLVTGVDASHHRVLFNGLLTRSPDGSMSIEPWRNKDLLVHARTVYDAAYEAGLTTAQVDWVAIYGARTITWSFPEQPDPKGLIEGELVSAGLVTRDQLADFDNSSPAWQDEIRTDAAVEILNRYKPDLMLLHLLDLDDINHQYGPMGNASLEAMAFLDDRVKQVVDALRNSHRPFTILVVSDHGFRKTMHTIYPNAVLRQAGIARDENSKLAWDAWVVPDGGTAMVYVRDPSRRSELTPRLSALFSGVDGVEHVYQQEDLAGLGLPLLEQSDQAPDLLIAAKPGYSFASGSPDGGSEASHGGTHGYLNSDSQMQAIFLAWGSGIRPGVRLDRISNLDVAPTIAALLGIEMTNVTGHPLRKILSDAPPLTSH
jgi:predicted AlkP superfamily pyrophosphatase or phosphodiesterase